MSIPDYQSLMRPVLEILENGKEQTVKEVCSELITQFSLTGEELEELLPSGRAKVFNNRVGWAVTYLKKAGALYSSRRGVYSITGRGQELLKDTNSYIGINDLMQFKDFREFKNNKPTVSQQSKGDSLQPTNVTTFVKEKTPEEALGQAWEEMRDSLELEVLDQIKQVTPQFFERLVVDVLVAMGYGGDRADASRAVGQSGDGGIDGIIDEDPLGLDVIYIQAKRWEGVVGRPEIQKFAGALQGRRAKKGVFITTSGFTKEASEYATMIDSRIVLITGRRLARLMIDHDVGVSSVEQYIVKRLDSDYFAE